MTVTVADLKAHMNIVDDLDDALLEQKIAAAMSFLDAYLETPIAEHDPVPAALDEAVRQLAAHLFENREATIVGTQASEIPFGPLELIGPYRKWSF